MTTKILILLSMVFCHIVDDYYLQGILANLKQKSFWQEHAPEKLYRNDYVVALMIHAFSWSFMISIPIFIMSGWNPHFSIYIASVINIVLHAIIDDLKANKKKINLITDQSLHMIQIVGTWLIWLLVR